LNKNFAMAAAIITVALAAWTATATLRAGMAAESPRRVDLSETIPSDGIVSDGPFVEINTRESAAGAVSGWPLHFADTNGKWRVLVFAATEHMAEVKLYRNIKYPALRLAQGMDKLEDMLAGVPNTELWLVRMDHRSDSGDGIVGGSDADGFGGACVGYKRVRGRSCFDRLVYAGAYAGSDGLYFLPQYQWFRKTFRSVPVLEGVMSDEIYAPFYLPYVAIVSPDGHVYGWRDSWAGVVKGPDGTPTQVSVCRAVLLTLSILRKERGEPAVAAVKPREVPTFWDYMEQSI
jgi:hypothetical protein